jgi:serine/threonine-protein kinase RsbT
MGREIYKAAINDRHDASIIVHEVAETVAGLPFSQEDEAKIVTACKEAVLNVVKYAGSGTIVLRWVCKHNIEGLEITVEDLGPGIPDMEQAMTHGYSTSHTMGVGLNVILNSMDRVVFVPKSRGMKLCMNKYIRRQETPCLFDKKSGGLEIAMKMVPYSFYTKSGDCGFASDIPGYLYFALWDVEGHGSDTVYASSMFYHKYFEAFQYYHPETVLRIVNRAAYQSSQTKRASAAVGSIDKNRGVLEIYRLGNVNFTLINEGWLHKSFDAHGVLGIESIAPLKERFENDEWNECLIYSDGVEPAKIGRSYAKAASKPLYAMVHEMLKECGSEDDDASLMAIRKGERRL